MFCFIWCRICFESETFLWSFLPQPEYRGPGIKGLKWGPSHCYIQWPTCRIPLPVPEFTALLTWETSVLPRGSEGETACRQAALGPSCHWTNRLNTGVTLLAGKIDLNDQREIRLLLHNRGKEECVWNQGTLWGTSGYLGTSMPNNKG